MYSGTPHDIEKFIVLLHTLSSYFIVQAEGTVTPMKTLVLTQHHVERIL